MDELELECKICSKKFINYKSLTSHLKIHKIKLKDYYDKFLKTGKDKCIICNNNTRLLSLELGYSKFCSLKCSNLIKTEETKQKIKESWKNKEKPENKKRILILKEVSLKKKGIKWKKNSKTIDEKKEIFKKLIDNLEFISFGTENILSCRICNFNTKTVRSFTSHISQTHEILIKDYYDNFIKKENEGKCKICKKETRFINYNKGYSSFCSSMKCVNNDGERINSIKKSFKENSLKIKEKLSRKAKLQWKNNQQFIQKMTEKKSDFRIKQAERQINRYKNYEERIKTSDSIKKSYENNPQLRLNASLHSKKLWEDPNSKFNSEGYMLKILSYFKRGIKTNPEKKVEEILKIVKNHNFIFTGNGKFWIMRKNPDFTDSKNKKVIEVFGDYYHSENFRKKFGDFSTDIEHYTQRIKHFEKYGYRCLILWERETKNFELCKNKIINFING